MIFAKPQLVAFPPPLSAQVLGRWPCHLPIFLPMHYCILSAELLVRHPPLSSCDSPCVFKYKIIDDEGPRQECILAEDRESLEQAHPSREPKSLHTAGQIAQITGLSSGSMAGFCKVDGKTLFPSALQK